MRMYNSEEVKNIVEEFLAEYLNLDSVSLTTDSIAKLINICCTYGVEVENMEKNND